MKKYIDEFKNGGVEVENVPFYVIVDKMHDVINLYGTTLYDEEVSKSLQMNDTLVDISIILQRYLERGFLWMVRNMGTELCATNTDDPSKNVRFTYHKEHTHVTFLITNDGNDSWSMRLSEKLSRLPS